jgi:hypothetical protein
MSGGRLTIWIDGREALPVRAIPYVAGWEHLYSPDVVAESLARAAAVPFVKLRNLVAYHRPTSKPLPVMTGEWAAVVAELKGFEAGLREQRPGTDAMDDHAGYAAWRKGAALKLPAGVFVWLDEFLREREADRKRTPDTMPVILAPMLDGDTRAALLEGFEDCPRRGPDADRAMIGYADFVAICHVDDPKNFGGFRLEANGLYVDLPDTDATLTPEERAAVSWHPTGQYDKPALPLPCTLGQLRAFVEQAGLLGCIDEEAVKSVFDALNDKCMAFGYFAGIARRYGEVDWAYWLSLQFWTAREAACLLVELNPDRYDMLAANINPQPRRLVEHIANIERKANRERDSAPPHQWAMWADVSGYVLPDRLQGVQAQIEELPADSGSGDGVAKVGAGATAATPSLTEIRIAAIVETATQLKYDPLSVATGGKAIIEAECLDKLKGAPHRFTADTFKKAWQAARDAGRIDVENVEIYRGQ